ncbi:MAG: MgtC/SapB family protein [Patescibacteria group bacterium]
MFDNWEIFGQLFLAMFLAGLLGLERALAGKVAGLRTFALVSMGSALLVIVSEEVSQRYFGLVDFDPLRVASQIVVGIGFLGAGLIIFREKKISGLTTAAGLWVSAGIGIAVGYKLYAIAIFATVLTLFVFTVMWFIEKKAKRVIEDIED